VQTSSEGLVWAGRRTGRPPGSSFGGAPVLPPATFTSLVGALGDLAAMADHWNSRAAAVLRNLSPPRVLLHPGEDASPQGRPTDMRVAVLEHPAGVAGTVVPALIELASDVAVGSVAVDPGYWLSPVTRGMRGSPPHASAPVWTTNWNRRHLPKLRGFPAPALPRTVAGAWATGRSRVLLIDTGDSRAVRQASFLVQRINTQDHPPRDWHGHGTSIGDLVRLRAPNAAVTALRIFAPGSRYSASPALLAALNWALHPIAGADIVCVAQRAEIGNDHAEHLAVVLTILEHAVREGFPLPVVVCAAGNSRGRRMVEWMSLPATAPGVLAVRAIGWRGDLLRYNCVPPRGATVDLVEAYGGEEHEPIGMTAAPSSEVRMIGTSYAAALVVGALAAG
jgi:hypothetical protein